MKAADIKAQILKDLGIISPASYTQSDQITRLVDARIGYLTACDSLAKAKTIVDQQHYRKMIPLWSREIDRINRLLGLDKQQNKHKKVADYFPNATAEIQRRKKKTVSG